MVNRYGPYHDQFFFWGNLAHCGLFNIPKLILGGELNFTTLVADICGEAVRPNYLSSYFSDIILEVIIFEPCPSPLIPTLINIQVGLGVIPKHLDRFLIF